MDVHERTAPDPLRRGGPNVAAGTRQSTTADRTLGQVARPVNGSTYRLRPSTSGFRRQRAADVAALFILAIAGAIFCAAMAWHGGHLWLVAALAVLSALVLCAGEVGK